MRKLKVLACAFACCPPGTPGFAGGEDVLGWNLPLQIGRRHDVWVLTDGSNRASVRKALADSPAPNIHFQFVDLPRVLHRLTSIQGGIQFYYWLWQIRAYFTARRLHREHRFDLFHHITYANDWMASYTGALLPVTYVRGPGGGAHRTPKGFETEYPSRGRVWEVIRSVGQWLFRTDPLFKKGQNKAKAILLCNRESIEAVPKKWAGKVQNFPVNGISTHDLELTAAPDAPNGEFRVITAGSLLRVKGFGLAIKAFGEFAKDVPSARFTIVGGGPEEPRLRAITQRLALEEVVTITGAMPRDQLLKQISNHDVFLFPSLRDGGGAVIVEAMCAGKPVVCIDSGGPGVHVSAETGVKIAPTSPEQVASEMAAALHRLHQDKDLRESLGNRARQVAERDYHWDRLGDRLMEIYREVLQVPEPIK